MTTEQRLAALDQMRQRHDADQLGHKVGAWPNACTACGIYVLAAGLAADDTAPHPGEPHRFAIACERCGLPGTLNLSIAGPDEAILVVDRQAGGQ